MTTTKQFKWVDRDTAARDMMLLAQHAPDSIRRRALQLLEAFHSPAIFPELEEIVMDEERNIRERRYALRAIASIPGDLYLPQFAHFASVEVYSQLSFDDFLGLFCNHPSNLQWAFQSIEREEPKAYLQTLMRSTVYGLSENLHAVLGQKIIEVIERNPPLLDLDVIYTLYYQERSDTILKWLQTQWDTLIYLCLVGNTDKVVSLLANWDELREAVFKDCPSIVDEYNQRKQEVDAKWSKWLKDRLAPIDYESSAIWHELNGLYEAALEGDRQAYGKLAYIVNWERENLSKRAVATNLLGKLKHKYDVRFPLFRALRYAPDDLQYSHSNLNASVRFEAGEALRDIPSPDVWETMVDAFFIRPCNVLESFLSAWIEYLTDRLSGIDTPYTGSKYADETKRFWFRALAASPAEVPD